jgi:hypothetical protein
MRLAAWLARSCSCAARSPPAVPAGRVAVCANAYDPCAESYAAEAHVRRAVVHPTDALWVRHGMHDACCCMLTVVMPSTASALCTSPACCTSSSEPAPSSTARLSTCACCTCARLATHVPADERAQHLPHGTGPCRARCMYSRSDRPHCVKLRP